MNAPAPTEAPQHHVYISLGSNIEPESNLPRAVALLRERSELLALSSAWRSSAVGSHGPEFLNAAALLRTPLTEPELKQILRSIEAALGRQRGDDPNAPRTIDLDILIFDGSLNEQGLWQFAHLALPLSELWPDLISPDGRALAECAAELRAGSDIRRAEGILA